MANRLLSNRIYSGEKDRKCITLKAVGAGAANLTVDAANSKGIISVVRSGAGTHTVTFGTVANGLNVIDTYVKLLSAKLTVTSTGTPAVGQMYLTTAGNLIASAGTLVIQLVSLAGLAADAAAADTLYIDFCFGDSTAP